MGVLRTARDLNRVEDSQTLFHSWRCQLNKDLAVVVTVETVTVWNAIESFERIALSGKAPATKQWYRAVLALLAREQKHVHLWTCLKWTVQVA